VGYVALLQYSQELWNDYVPQFGSSDTIGFSIIALLIVSALLWKNSHTMTSTGIGLALILGGAIGNLWDRLVSHHVVDFLLFYIGPHQWPAFNVADSAIVVGACLLVFEIVFTNSPKQQSA